MSEKTTIYHDTNQVTSAMTSHTTISMTRHIDDIERFNIRLTLSYVITRPLFRNRLLPWRCQSQFALRLFDIFAFVLIDNYSFIDGAMPAL